MKLRRPYAWLFAGPLTLLSGCGVGPISGLAQREPIVSLKEPEPLAALEHSTRLWSDDADEGALARAAWRPRSNDPEDRRLLLLTSARRRASQQMGQQMMMNMSQMMQELQQPAGPSHPSSGQGGASNGASKAGSQPQSAAPMATPQMVMPQMMMSPDMLAGPPQRRGLRFGRGREEAKDARADAKVNREETAATTEADRIERTAKAEAERAEKAALAEATIAERRLLAEAELAERMTRAELELAERLAFAKEERDRRINMAREERDLRMAILGIDTQELDSDPVDEALSRLGTKEPQRAESESGSSRFARFWRSRSEEVPAKVASAPRQTEVHKPKEHVDGDADAPAVARNRSKPPEDLVDRALDHSNSLLDDPSIAEFASSRPAEFPSIVRKDGAEPSAPPRAEPAYELPAVHDEYDSLLAREEISRVESHEPEDWSLLNDFLAGSSPSVSPEAAPVAAPDFPVFDNLGNRPFPAAEVAPTIADSATSVPDVPSIASAPPAAEPTGGDSIQRRPEDDLWILGGGDRNLAANASAADREFPQAAPETAVRSEDFTNPGGLFARSTAVEAPSVEPAAAATIDNAVTPPAFPTWDLANLDSTAGNASSLAATSGPAAGASADPWVNGLAPQTAAVETSSQPHFDWSHSEPEGVDRVVHHPLPKPETTIQNAAWVHQSLRDICGPLPQDLEALVLQLDIPEAGVRKAVLEDLARMGSKARPAAPAIRVLLDDSPLVAAHAAWTLWQVEANETQTVNDLVRLLQTGDSETVQFTAYALGSLGPKALSSATTLRSERERFNGATRVHVAEALTKIDAFDQASVEVLVYGLQHPDTHVRWLSALALGEVQTRYASVVIPSLIATLKDADPEVRSAAALSIGGFGRAAESAVPELQSRAALDAPSVREAAQTALACIRK